MHNLSAVGGEHFPTPSAGYLQAFAKIQATDLAALRKFFADAIGAEFETVRAQVQADATAAKGLVVGFASSMEKVLPRADMPNITVASRAELSVARYEKESLQVIVSPCTTSPTAPEDGRRVATASPSGGSTSWSGATSVAKRAAAGALKQPSWNHSRPVRISESGSRRVRCRRYRRASRSPMRSWCERSQPLPDRVSGRCQRVSFELRLEIQVPLLGRLDHRADLLDDFYPLVGVQMDRSGFRPSKSSSSGGPHGQASELRPPLIWKAGFAVTSYSVPS